MHQPLTAAMFFSAGVQTIDFITMTRGMQPVRRLSTVSSVKKPLYYKLTTKWLWYYKGDRGNWVEYGELVSWSTFRITVWERAVEEYRKCLFSSRSDVCLVRPSG